MVACRGNVKVKVKVGVVVDIRFFFSAFSFWWVVRFVWMFMGGWIGN